MGHPVKKRKRFLMAKKAKERSQTVMMKSQVV
jgi:hypothetical protein